jgi:hypothetical protein
VLCRGFDDLCLTWKLQGGMKCDTIRDKHSFATGNCNHGCENCDRDGERKRSNKDELEEKNKREEEKRITKEYIQKSLH